MRDTLGAGNGEGEDKRGSGPKPDGHVFMSDLVHVKNNIYIVAGIGVDRNAS